MLLELSPVAFHAVELSAVTLAEVLLTEVMLAEVMLVDVKLADWAASIVVFAAVVFDVAFAVRLNTTSNGGGDGVAVTSAIWMSLGSAAALGSTSTNFECAPTSNRHWMRPSAAARSNPSPRIEMIVPPSAGPRLGEISEMVGSTPYVY